MRRLIILGTASAVLLLLVLAQLVLPGLAAQRLRDRLSHSGQVLKVEVDAFPAIELLWHQADHVVVRLARYSPSPGHLGSLLQEAGNVGTLDAVAGELDTGLLTMRNARLSKRGDRLTGSAHISESDLRAAVPFLDNVQAVASGPGQLTLRGTASALGLSAAVDATVAARSGQLVVAPDVPFGGLATVTVFSNPNVQVLGVSATNTSDGFTVSAVGKLR